MQSPSASLTDRLPNTTVRIFLEARVQLFLRASNGLKILNKKKT